MELQDRPDEIFKGEEVDVEVGGIHEEASEVRNLYKVYAVLIWPFRYMRLPLLNY